MKPLFLTGIFLLTTTVFADDAVRNAQAELKNLGFYFGEVDGKPSNETTAAIRRYQIRNGLQVTGTMNEETLKALGLGSGTPPPPVELPMQKTTPAPQQANPPTIDMESTPGTPPPTRDLLSSEQEPRSQTPRRALPGEPGIVDPPRAIPPAVEDDYTTFFHGTPYATAPREIQRDIVRKAQLYLARRNLYREFADGLPGPVTSEALFLYQEQRRIARTGRLDLQTLGDLNLLPGRSPDAPPLKSFRDPDRSRDRSVDYRGLIR